MNATEIRPLTPDAILKLLTGRQAGKHAAGKNNKRRTPRWSFPAPVELWIPQEDGSEEYMLATCENLSASGVGVRCDEDLPLGCELAIAIHQPEMSLHGRATVCHSTKMADDYYAGLEFTFDAR